jgi:methylenetetrahydrofolate reductase (NADPH)
MTGGVDKDQASGGLSLSFEVFPPRNDAQADQISQVAASLETFDPAFISVTYGAGGSTRERSVATIHRLARETAVPLAAHLTCVGASCQALDEVIDDFRGLGVERFVVLRGDSPDGVDAAYRPHPHGYQDTADLVRHLKTTGASQISVSAYPERHPDSPDWRADIGALKRKVDAGADSAITQFFFNNDDYESYVGRVRAAGLSIPVVPGILPIHNINAVRDFAGRCGASVPRTILRRFEGIEPRTAGHRRAAIEIAQEQIEDLIARDVGAFHFYTLNRGNLVVPLCRWLRQNTADSKAA